MAKQIGRGFGQITRRQTGSDRSPPRQTLASVLRVLALSHSGATGPLAHNATQVDQGHSACRWGLAVANARPRQSSIASAGNPPDRSNVGSGMKPTMVLSTPTPQAPPSNTASIRPESPSITCRAVVGLIRPEGLADGAATGPLKAASSLFASGCSGTRIATLGKPALTRAEMPASGLSGRTRVNGPGQNAEASLSASASNSAISLAASTEATCTISGLNCGRPFALKICATAASLRASAPNP